MLYVKRRNLAKYLEVSPEPLAQLNWEHQLGRKNFWGNSLVVQWLGLHTFTAKGPGLIPGQETKIHKSHSTAKKKKKKRKKSGVNKLEIDLG